MQVALRVAVFVLLSLVGIPIGILYLVFPVLAALLVSGKTGRQYLDEDGDKVTRWLRVVIGLVAYLWALTDRLPGWGGENVRLEVARSGNPTAGSALLRILYGLPSAIVLAILGIASAFAWVVAVGYILLRESYPPSLWRFQLGVVRWEARLLAYLASLVEPYPPFSLETRSASEGTFG